jgi:hypothetical protein
MDRIRRRASDEFDHPTAGAWLPKLANIQALEVIGFSLPSNIEHD